MRYLVKLVLLLSLAVIFSCGTSKKGDKIEGVSRAQMDSVSYAVGRSLGEIIKTADLGTLDYRELVKGIRDVVEDNQTPYDKENYLMEVERYLQKRADYAGKKLSEQANDYFEKNGKRDGVTVTESGLQYSIIDVGGELIPTDTDMVTLLYEISLIDGTVVDSNFDKIAVTLAMNNIIEGWREGLKLIGVYGRIKLSIPSSLAYGEREFGVIPANSPLVCELEIVSVKHAEEKAEGIDIQTEGIAIPVLIIDDEQQQGVRPVPAETPVRRR